MRPDEALKILAVFEGKLARLKEERDNLAKAKEALELSEPGDWALLLVIFGLWLLFFFKQYLIIVIFYVRHIWVLLLESWHKGGSTYTSLGQESWMDETRFHLGQCVKFSAPFLTTGSHRKARSLVGYLKFTWKMSDKMLRVCVHLS